MSVTAFRSKPEGFTGGRVLLLFLLFGLAIYQFVHAGYNSFAIICIIPVLVLFCILTLKHRLFVFWILTFYNYFLQWKSFPVTGLPTSLPNEMMELLLIALALIDVKESKFERLANIMFGALLVWSAFCTLEILNDSCGLGIQIGAWYTGARLMAFQLLYAFIVYILYISKPDILIKYLIIWGGLAIFASFWVWKQQHFGLTVAENAFLQGRGRSTHLINAGTTIRYFSIFSDAANFGINAACTAVCFFIFGITSKIKKYRYYFLIVGILCAWAMFPSGTRTATFCFLAGFAAYIILSKSFKIAIPAAIVFFFIYFFLAFTTIGQGNAQIRRMRSGFNKNDASMGAREMNQQVMKKYLAEAPWGIGLGIGFENVPANNKYRKLATLPPDSEYVFIWVHTGPIGITIFIITTIIIFIGASWIVFFKLDSPSLRGIGAGLCCGFVSFQLGGYANQVLMQFPNCLIFYGGISLVYALPHIEKDWVRYEAKLLEAQAEKERIKQEKKRARRV